MKSIMALSIFSSRVLEFARKAAKTPSKCFLVRSAFLCGGRRSEE